jgi:hypothetical protein
MLFLAQRDLSGYFYGVDNAEWKPNANRSYFRLQQNALRRNQALPSPLTANSSFGTKSKRHLVRADLEADPVLWLRLERHTKLQQLDDNV